MVGPSPEGLEQRSRGEEQNSDRPRPEMQLSERSKKEIQTGEFNLLPSGRTSPDHRRKRCSFVVRRAGKKTTKSQQWEQHPIRVVGCADWRGTQGGTWTHHGTGGITPNFPPAGAEGSCPHPSLWAPYPRPGTLPATRSRHIPRSTRFAVWQRWISSSSSGFGTKPACTEEDTAYPWHGFQGGQRSATRLVARLCAYKEHFKGVEGAIERYKTKSCPNACEGRQRRGGKQSGTL